MVGRHTGGITDPTYFFKGTTFQNFYYGESAVSGQTEYSGFPLGYNSSYSWALPPKSGGISMRTTGTGTFAADLVPTRPMTIDITGTGTLAATAALAISMSIDLDGSGTFAASIEGRLAMSVDFTGSGELEAAIGALGNMLADFTGSGDLDATIGGIADMDMDIVVTGTGLTLENVSIAVWESLAADFNTAGTMGEKLNDAGSAGNPWASLLASNNSAGSFGEFIQALPSSLDIASQILDSSDVETSVTVKEALRIVLSALAGKLSGAGTTAITIRDVNDTKDRITATVDASGNRTAVTVDGS